MYIMENKTIIDLFTTQVEKESSRVAIVDSRNSITFKKLDETSNQVANYLLANGCQKEDIVVIHLDKSIESIISILGVLKVGATYLVLETDYPNQRLNSIINDCKPSIIITSNEINLKISNSDNLILHFEDHKNYKKLLSHSLSQNADSLAYLIYTSGSTGKPKGVKISHGNVINLIEGLNEKIFRGKTNQRLALLAPLTFDASVQQLFSSLCLGNTLVLCPDLVKKDPKLLIDFFNKNQINVSDGTPSHLKMLNTIKGATIFLDQFLIGGEILSIDVMNKFYSLYHKSNVEVFNVYGVAECCVDSTCYKINKEIINELGFIPIGKPLKGTRIFILDENNSIVPDGVKGEIYIGGSGIGKGYINNNTLTSKKFNLYNQDLIYKTGDIGRKLQDGNIQFIGRMDRQINLRGHRIELEEIEKRIQNYQENISPNITSSEVCNNCLLDDTYPNVTITNGICNICQDFKSNKSLIMEYFKTPDDFKTILKKAQKQKNSEYDCMLLYSGGKDSTYVLYKLVQLGLKVLTFTFDNGFISKTAFDNIQRITTGLDVDNITMATKNMNEIFVESLQNDKTVCSGCFRGLTSLSTRLAKEKGINMIITGLSRGQIIDTKLSRFYDIGVYDEKEIENRLLIHRKFYHAINDKTSKLIGGTIDESSLDEIYFIDYFRYDEVSTKKIREYLAKNDNLWKTPKDVGFCSTNCKMNDVGISIHKKAKGFHNYAKPLSWEVRLNSISRAEGKKEIDVVPNENNVNDILDSIGFKLNNSEKRDIKDVIVIAKNNNIQEKELVAFFTATNLILIENLRNYLSKYLADYMIPTKIFQLEKFPLNKNGKIDTAALKAEKFNSYTFKIKPVNLRLTELEKRVISIWEEVLGIENVSMSSNFINLGGDSLMATILISTIEQEFKINLSVTEAFVLPTVKYMVSLIKKNIEINKPTNNIEVLRMGQKRSENIFLIHDVFGDIESYKNMIDGIDPKYFIWGIRSNYIPEKELTYNQTSITNIAKHYISLIKKIQPNGKYIIGGWSFGGIIAYEIGSILEKKYSDKPTLVLIDSNCPLPKVWEKILRENINNLLKIDPHLKNRDYDNWKNILDTIISLNPSLPLEIIRDALSEDIKKTIRNAENRVSLNWQITKILYYVFLLSKYEPNIATKLSIFYLKATKAKVPMYGSWEFYTRSFFHKEELPENHFSIINSPKIIEVINNLSFLKN